MNLQIKNLKDLDNLRTAPKLEISQKIILLKEIDSKILIADWITVGIMAPNDLMAKESLKSFLRRYMKIHFKSFDDITAAGQVFLKGNQKTGNVFIRSEDGLGEGILLTCQYEDQMIGSNTYGPFPLDFFE